MISFKAPLSPVTQGHIETQGGRAADQGSQTGESNRQAINPTPTPICNLLSGTAGLCFPNPPRCFMVNDDDGDLLSKSLLVRTWGDVSQVPEFGCPALLKRAGCGNSC